MRWKRWAFVLGCLHVCTAENSLDADGIADEAVRLFGLDGADRPVLVSGAENAPANAKISPDSLTATQALFVAMCAARIHAPGLPKIVERLITQHSASPVEMVTPRLSPACQLILWTSTSAIGALTASMARSGALPDWQYPGPVVQALIQQGQLMPLMHLYGNNLVLAAEDLGVRVDKHRGASVVPTIAEFAMERTLLEALRLPWISQHQIETYEKILRERYTSYSAENWLGWLAASLGIPLANYSNSSAMPTSLSDLDPAIVGASGGTAASATLNSTSNSTNPRNSNAFTLPAMAGPETSTEWAIKMLTKRRNQSLSALAAHGANVAEIIDAASFARATAKAIGSATEVPTDLRQGIFDTVNAVRPYDIKSPTMGALYEEAARARSIAMIDLVHIVHATSSPESHLLAIFHIARSGAFATLSDYVALFHVALDSTLPAWSDQEIGRYTAQHWIANAMYGVDVDVPKLDRSWALLFAVLRDSTAAMRFVFNNLGLKVSHVLYEYVAQEVGILTGNPEDESRELLDKLKLYVDDILSAKDADVASGIADTLELLAKHFSARLKYIATELVKADSGELLKQIVQGYKNIGKQASLRTRLKPYVTKDTSADTIQILVKAGVAQAEDMPGYVKKPAEAAQPASALPYAVPQEAVNYFRVVGIVIAVIVGVLVLLSALLCVFWIRLRRRPRNYE